MRQTKFIWLLKNYTFIQYYYYWFRNGLSNLFYNDEGFYRKEFKKTYGRYPDIKNPKTFNEKLIWSMLNHRNDIYIKCADKYEVREIVKMKVGVQYLVKCYDIYDKLEQIKFEKLPDSFVMKATHASAWNLICLNKKELKFKKELKVFKYWLTHNYYNFYREWPYNYMQKRIICEQYIGDKHGNPPMDYKIYCFNGVPKVIQLDIDRFKNHKRNIYNTEWELLKDAVIVFDQDFSREYEKPKNFEEMLDIAGKLSQGFEHVRIDLYNVEGKIYFGEMTFFSYAGTGGVVKSDEFHLLLGSWFNLPKANILKN